MGILSNPIMLGGGGAALNIDYGTTPPSDTTKLWVPLASKPGKVTCSPVLNYGSEYIVTLDNTVPNAHRDSACSAAVDNKIYLFGGYGSNTITLYDPATDTYTTKAAVFEKNVAEASCVAVGTKIYIFGGYAGSTAYNTIWCYDTTADVLTSNSNMPAARCGTSCAHVDGKIYVFGGRPGSGTAVSTIYCYNIATNTCASVGKNLVYACAGTACAAIGDKIYVIGGGSRSSAPYTLQYIQCYNTTANTVSVMTATLPNGVVSPSCAAYGNRIYTFGGDVNSICCFDALSDTVTTLPITIGQYRRLMACAAIDRDIYIFGGTWGNGRSTTQWYTNIVQRFTVETVLQHNDLILQADFGFDNPFPLINTDSVVITAYLRSAYLGDSNDIAQLTDAYIYNDTAQEWQTLSGESYVADMLNALAILGVT